MPQLEVEKMAAFYKLVFAAQTATVEVHRRAGGRSADKSGVCFVVSSRL